MKMIKYYMNSYGSSQLKLSTQLEYVRLWVIKTNASTLEKSSTDEVISKLTTAYYKGNLYKMCNL